MTMRIAAWVTLFYGLLVIAGGIIGYIKAASTVSLIMGGAFGILLTGSAIGIFKGKVYSAYVAILLTLILDAFFSFRWLFTHKFMPSGLMSLVSLAVLMVLAVVISKRSNPQR